MIQKKTVFILGAGASVPYGYPSGEKLLKQISSLGSDTRFKKFVDEISATQHPREQPKLSEIFDSFVVDLSSSGLLSVDSFVVVKPEYAALCKFAITYFLLGVETNNRFSISEDEDWYRYLYHNFIDEKNFEDVCNNEISFITFNYDVSLDGFFLRAINSKFPGKAVTFFKNIEVLHIHGKIRTYPWEKNPISSTPSDFRFDMNEKYYVWNSSLGIKFAFEDIAQETIKRAQELLKKAQNVYFLGFGFHPDNLEKLKIDWMNQYLQNTHTGYFATAFKLTDAEIRKIINDAQGFNSRSGQILLKLEPRNCLDFIKNIADVI